MIPRTYPSTYNANNTTKIVTYQILSVTGLREWVDYIPVKNVTEPTSNNIYDQTGAMLIDDTLESISGLIVFKDYVPVYFDNSKTQAWSTNANGYIPVTTVEVSGGGATIPVIVFDHATADYMSKTGQTFADATYNRMYVSLWVERTGNASSGSMGGGWVIEDPDSASTVQAASFSYDALGGSKWYFRYNAATPGIEFDYKDLVDDVTAKWTHILIEVDTTEAVEADRVKFYLNDVKRTAFNIAVPINATFDMGTATDTNQVIKLITDSIPDYGITNATLKVAGFWLKFGTTNLFNFDSVTDRRYFIDASKGYVTHAASMGGQTAQQWGAGTKSNWTSTAGWTENGTITDSTTASPATATD